jgi:hypothetical protein
VSKTESPRAVLPSHSGKLKRKRGDEILQEAGMNIKQSAWYDHETMALSQLAKRERSMNSRVRITQSYAQLQDKFTILNLRRKWSKQISCKLADLSKKQNIYSQFSPDE